MLSPHYKYVFKNMLDRSENQTETEKNTLQHCFHATDKKGHSLVAFFICIG